MLHVNSMRERERGDLMNSEDSKKLKTENYNNTIKTVSREPSDPGYYKWGNNEQFGKIPRQEETPSLPNPNKNFVNTYTMMYIIFFIIFFSLPLSAGYADNITISPRCRERVHNQEDFNFLSILDEVMEKIKEDENFSIFKCGYNGIPDCVYDIASLLKKKKNIYNFYYEDVLGLKQTERSFSFQYDRGGSYIQVYKFTFFEEKRENQTYASINVDCRTRSIDLPSTVSGVWKKEKWSEKDPSIKMSGRSFEKIATSRLKPPDARFYKSEEAIYCHCKFSGFVHEVDYWGFYEKFGNMMSMSDMPDYKIYIRIFQVEWLKNDEDPESCEESVDMLKEEMIRGEFPQGSPLAFNSVIDVHLLENGKVKFDYTTFERAEENDRWLFEYFERLKVKTTNTLVPWTDFKLQF